MEETLAPLRKFMFTQTRPQDLSLFVKLAKMEKPKTGRSSDHGFDSGVCDFGIEDRISNWIHYFSPVFDNRHGCRQCADGDGNDDAPTGGRFVAV